jgi:hypothetical protein
MQVTVTPAPMAVIKATVGPTGASHARAVRRLPINHVNIMAMLTEVAAVGSQLSKRGAVRIRASRV